VGTFIYKYKKFLDVVKIPDFKGRIKPMTIVPILKNQGIPNKRPHVFLVEKDPKLAMIVGAIYGGAIVIALIAALSLWL